MLPQWRAASAMFPGGVWILGFGTDLFRVGHSLVNERARLYESVRTAHLERAHQLASAAIFYRVRRYDFDAELARGLELIEASPLKAAAILFRSKVTALEINEPLMLSSLPATSAAILALAVRRLLGGPRVLVVSYAIGNTNPYTERLHYSWKASLRKSLERILAAMVGRRVDRIAFGTEASREIYRSLLPGASQRVEALIPALPAPCHCPQAQAREPGRVIYLGDMSERKGFPLMLEAWEDVRRLDSGATLTIVGKGALQAEALSRAAADPTVETFIDPPRSEIHRQLRRAQVLVLPSQATPTWREQVGLPIVEGLAHGCSIVTTTETGLASWLADHHHEVLEPDCTALELSEAIRRRLASAAPAEAVIATLPLKDGRLAADDWLFEPDRSAHGS
jgi:glycosyltransferase involved in cell wall biosynthesis